MADSRDPNVPPCPACANPSPDYLKETSKGTDVNYYRCGQCQHVWAVDRQNPFKVTHLTPFMRRNRDQGNDG